MNNWKFGGVLIVMGECVVMGEVGECVREGRIREWVKWVGERVEVEVGRR